MAPLLLLAVFLFAQGGGIYAPVRARKPRLPKVDRGACPFEGCQKNCDAALLDNGQTVWWVKIKTKEGQVGWVKDMNFDGMDALAQMLPRPIWSSGVLLLFL